MKPIGVLRTCFKDKFGVPRQPGLVKSALGVLKLEEGPFYRNAVNGLNGFSHVWVIFIFHQHASKNWKPSVRPPRLGGARKVGVLASRSPHRPNPIGLSALKLERIDLDAPGGIELHLSGVDILDGTPVLDIKPYLSYTDSIPEALSGWAVEPIQRTPVQFSDLALQRVSEFSEPRYPNLKDLIIGILELDPRPAFQQRRFPMGNAATLDSAYGFRLFDFDVKWVIRNDFFYVENIVHLEELPCQDS